jgi:hypothetical protein
MTGRSKEGDAEDVGQRGVHAGLLLDEANPLHDGIGDTLVTVDQAPTSTR